MMMAPLGILVVFLLLVLVVAWALNADYWR